MPKVIATSEGSERGGHEFRLPSRSEISNPQTGGGAGLSLSIFHAMAAPLATTKNPKIASSIIQLRVHSSDETRVEWKCSLCIRPPDRHKLDKTTMSVETTRVEVRKPASGRHREDAFRVVEFWDMTSTLYVTGGERPAFGLSSRLRQKYGLHLG
jgi:hypothetical protein